MGRIETRVKNQETRIKRMLLDENGMDGVFVFKSKTLTAHALISW